MYSSTDDKSIHVRVSFSVVDSTAHLHLTFLHLNEPRRCSYINIRLKLYVYKLQPFWLLGISSLHAETRVYTLRLTSKSWLPGRSETLRRARDRLARMAKCWVVCDYCCICISRRIAYKCTVADEMTVLRFILKTWGFATKPVLMHCCIEETHSQYTPYEPGLITVGIPEAVFKQ